MARDDRRNPRRDRAVRRDVHVGPSLGRAARGRIRLPALRLSAGILDHARDVNGPAGACRRPPSDEPRMKLLQRISPAGLIIAWSLLVHIPGITSPLLDYHAYRQCQTASM